MLTALQVWGQGTFASNLAITGEIVEGTREVNGEAALLVRFAKRHPAIVAPATVSMKNFLPGVAALLDVMQISNIIAFGSADMFERRIYAGNAVQTVRSTDATKVIAVRVTAFAAAAQDGATAPIEALGAVTDLGVMCFAGEELAKSDRLELTSARIIVSGGRVLQSRENFARYFEPVADRLAGAVDAAYALNDWQVDQTGTVVAPDLYVALGILGAIQHLAGIKDSKVILTINKDGETPIFQVADLALPGDLFQLLPELEQELQKAEREARSPSMEIEAAHVSTTCERAALRPATRSLGNPQ